MKKILSILGTITIAGSGMSGLVGNAPAPSKTESNSLKTNNLEILNRSKRENTLTWESFKHSFENIKKRIDNFSWSDFDQHMRKTLSDHSIVCPPPGDSCDILHREVTAGAPDYLGTLRHIWNSKPVQDSINSYINNYVRGASSTDSNGSTIWWPDAS